MQLHRPTRYAHPCTSLEVADEEFGNKWPFMREAIDRRGRI